jgi:hypothetical protein
VKGLMIVGWQHQLTQPMLRFVHYFLEDLFLGASAPPADLLTRTMNELLEGS